MPYVLSLLTIVLMIFALITVITSRDDQVKFLPKMAWIIIVILLPLIGSVLWFTIGREYDGGGISLPRRQPRQAPRAQTQTWAPPTEPIDTRTTEQQIADLDREIEEWRLREEIERRKQERGETGAS